jgi:hypothetical protein
VGTTTLSVDDPRYVAVEQTPVPFTTLTYVQYVLQSVSSRRLALHTAAQLVVLGANLTATGEVGDRQSFPRAWLTLHSHTHTPHNSGVLSPVIIAP